MTKIILLIFLICFALQQFYHWMLFSAFSFHKAKKKNGIPETMPISVVVCGKNESKKLRRLIAKLSTQEYSELEIVFVDDHSTDNTEQLALQLQQEYPQLQVVTKEKVVNRKGKKQALYAGVCHATHDHIVVLDADCEPATTQWLSHYALAFSSGAQLVLGLSPNTASLGFWQGFFRFETYLTALHYGSFALRGMPYMGVGRNMGYTKAFFMTHFPAVLSGELSSGDDDLLVNLGATKSNTKLIMHPDAMTFSPCPDNLRQWFRQKTRHLTAGVEYKFIHKLCIAGFPITLILGFVSACFICFTQALPIAILFFLWYYFTISVIHGFGLRKFSCQDLILETPIYLLLWCMFIPVISIYSSILKPKHWN